MIRLFYIYILFYYVYAFDLPNIGGGSLDFELPKIGDFYENLKENIGVEKETNGSCYKDIGCFHNTYPWISILRPLPLPENPEQISTTLFFNDKIIHLFNVSNWGDFGYNPQLQHNVFITHGFSSYGNSSWVENLKNAYLKKRKANVFQVDWSKGANHANYLQVAANTRIVGAEVFKFTKYLIDKYKVDPKSIHLIGHSLGSHISSYVAKQIKSVRNKTIDQITALDPAQPAFEKCSQMVRLDQSDADFVDVFHTNTRPIIPLLGFGFIEPIGHNDYYFNGGIVQPGCKSPTLTNIKISSISDLKNIPVNVISEWVACSHGRSYLYYTESIENEYCTFWGKPSGKVNTAINALTLGKSENIIKKFIKCDINNCSPLGLNAKNNKLRGVFSVVTHSSPPFCKN